MIDYFPGRGNRGEKDPSPGRATPTPSHEKTGWSERGKARDLAVEKEGKTEAISQSQTTWVKRLSAVREAQGASRETTGPARADPEQAKAPEGPVMPREDRSKTSRTASTQDEKAASSEPTPSKPEAREPAAKSAGKNKAGWVDRDQAPQSEAKQPERGTFGEKRQEQAKEAGPEKAPKPRATPAREKPGKTNENER